MRRVAQAGPLAYAVAAEGTRAVLAATGRAPAVLVSSSAVYGLSRAAPARESDAVPLEQVLAYVVIVLGTIPLTFSEFRALYLGAQRDPGA